MPHHPAKIDLLPSISQATEGFGRAGFISDKAKLPMQNEFRQRSIYEKRYLFVGAGAACIGWLRRTDSDNDDNYSGSDNNRSGPGGGSDQDSASPSG
jgi:hypothetical protein